MCLISRESQIAHNREHNYHDCFTLCRGLCPIPMRTNLVTFWKLENLHVATSAKGQVHCLGCAARRSLHTFTKVYPGYCPTMLRLPTQGHHRSAIQSKQNTRLALYSSMVHETPINVPPRQTMPRGTPN
jgi:hypothetical protein